MLLHTISWRSVEMLSDYIQMFEVLSVDLFIYVIHIIAVSLIIL